MKDQIRNNKQYKMNNEFSWRHKTWLSKHTNHSENIIKQENLFTVEWN